MTTRMIGSALTIDPPSPDQAARLRQTQERRAQQESPAFLDGPEHVITGGRQEGKTRLALKWLADAPDGTQRVLVVTSEAAAAHLKSDCGWQRNDPRIIHFRRLINQGARKGVEYGIDESVHILSDLLGLHEAPRLVTVGHAEAWQTGKASGSTEREESSDPRCEKVSRGIRCALRPGHSKYHSFVGPWVADSSLT